MNLFDNFLVLTFSWCLAWSLVQKLGVGLLACPSEKILFKRNDIVFRYALQRVRTRSVSHSENDTVALRVRLGYGYGYGYGQGCGTDTSKDMHTLGTARSFTHVTLRYGHKVDIITVAVVC